MAGGAAGQQQKMRDFVSRLFQGNPDLSILTHAIIRKKYLDDVGLENISKQEKEQLKQLVEEELIQMKVDQLPGNVELRTETQDSFKSGNRKRPLHISHSSEDEIKNEQDQKRQKIEKELEVSSDEKDSGIDSKKRPCHGSPKLLRVFSDSSDQEDSGAGNHSAESESNEETTKSKRKPSLQEARGERGQGRRSPKGQGIRGSQKREVSESEETTTDTGQSDLEEEVKEHRKVTKGNRGFKKKVDKGSKATDPKGKAKNRMMNKQREERSLSEEGSDLSEVEEISEKKREWSEREEKKTSSTNKAQQRMRPGTQKGSKGNESEDASGSGPDKNCNLQKKMADSQCRRKSRVIEDSGSSSEDSASQSPVRKEGAKGARGERGSQQTGNHSKPKWKPKERGRKKMQREDLPRKKLEEVKKVTQRIEESTSEESESESGEHKSMEAEKKWVQDPASSEGESQRETNQGPPRKAALISPPSESESDGDPRRTLEKKSKHVSGCDSSQGEEKLKKRRAQSETNQGQPRKAALISHPSESESDDSEDVDPRRTLEKESKHVSESDSSQGEEKLKKRRAQSETNQGQPRKAALISHPSESESDDSEDVDPRRTLEKESKHVSECDSSQGEEKLKKRRAQNKTNQGQPRKAALISHPSESESDDSEDGDPKRTLEKESKHVSECDSSQGEEKLKRRAQNKTNQGQPRKAALISHPSESESDDSEDVDPRRTLEKESKHVSECDSSQGEEKLKKRRAQNKTNQGQPRKAALISHPSESESDDSEDGDPKRTLEKQSKHVSECDSSQGEEKLKKRRAQNKTNQGQPRKAALISHPSESESDDSEDGDPRRTLEKESKHVSECDSSQGEEKLKKRRAQNKTNQGQPRKAALISHPSESESDDSEDGDPRRTLEKQSKHVSECDSSQGEEKLKRRGAQKSQRKSIGKEISVLGSEDSGTEFTGKKKIKSQQQSRTKKLQRSSATKKKQGEESSQEEGSSSEEDEPSTSQQHHLGKDKKHHSGKKEEHPSIQRLKRYIWECGVRQNYKKLLAGCHSRKSQIEVLKEELGSLGIKGTPSLAKCKAVKQKREEAAEVASLDINNIITTEGRPKRRKVWSLYNKPQESPSSPEEPAVRRHTTDWSQLRGVISSDGESS